MDQTEIQRRTYYPGRGVRVTDRRLRLARSPGIITGVNIGRGAPYAMVLLDRPDYVEPIAFDLGQLLVRD